MSDQDPAARDRPLVFNPNPTVRELLELQDEFQEPFVVDSTKIAAKLDVHPTPLDQALASYRTNSAA
jgi:hypothetical protein